MDTLKELYHYREMIVSLVRKGLRGRYKGSVLGFLWTFINPLLQLVVYTIVFSNIMKSGIEKFYLFLFVALIPWMFFSASVTGGASCIIAEGNLVKKVYFPRQVLPISYVTTAFVNMLLTFVIVLFALIVGGIGLDFGVLIYLPAVMLVEYLLALGIAMLTSALTVFFRDLEHILGIVTMAWMYLTPIMYEVDRIPEQYLTVFRLNPMTPIIMAYRDILYYKQTPKLSTLAQALAWGILILLIGSFIFNILQKYFAEEL
ncbi:ABC transporter permease [Lachnospiraceae bacterium 47-T17]